MSRFRIAAKTMRDYRIPIISMAVVAALIGLMDIAIYPQYRDSVKDFDIGFFETMVGEAGTLASPEGFLSAEFYSWVPLLFITVAIIAATGTTAGEEAAGTLDLLLAQPVTRRRLLLEKAGGLAIALTLGSLASMSGFLVAKLFTGFAIGPVRLLEATAYMVPVTLLFTTLALWAGVTFATRGAASMVVIGVVIASYFLQLLGGTVKAMNDIRKISPFYWSDASGVLVHGFDWPRAVGMLAVAGLFLGLALWSFERRDIASGRREWSLATLLRRKREAEPEPALPSGRAVAE
jgi:ABC-2 type transport system permease protein